MFIFNLWKHHLNETKKILKIYQENQVPIQKILSILNKMGKNQFDLYIGNLTIREIIQDFNTSKKETYNGTNFFLCKDQSLWIYQTIYKNYKSYIHFFPARKSILCKFSNFNSNLHLRFHSNSYKTLLLSYWLYLNTNKDKEYEFYIENARKLLKFSTIDFNKSKTLEKFKSLFIASY